MLGGAPTRMSARGNGSFSRDLGLGTGDVAVRGGSLRSVSEAKWGVDIPMNEVGNRWATSEVS